jgi:hypothetical protein
MLRNCPEIFAVSGGGPCTEQGDARACIDVPQLAKVPKVH